MEKSEDGEDMVSPGKTRGLPEAESGLGISATGFGFVSEVAGGVFRGVGDGGGESAWGGVLGSVGFFTWIEDSGGCAAVSGMDWVSGGAPRGPVEGGELIGAAGAGEVMATAEFSTESTTVFSFSIGDEISAWAMVSVFESRMEPGEGPLPWLGSLSPVSTLGGVRIEETRELMGSTPGSLWKRGMPPA